MKTASFKIQGIPALLWGEQSDRLYIAVHGSMSRKDDEGIKIFAEEATAKGYQVLSFDLPEHGDRQNEPDLCIVQNCVRDLNAIMAYAQQHISANISVFGCSMGAYFSLLAYKDLQLEQSLFLSPVLDMERVINNMMTWFHITEEKLKTEREIETPIGQKLYWDYYCYVKANPINHWNQNTSILYGSDDKLVEFDVVTKFVDRHHCNLTVLEHGEHYFHTKDQLEYFRIWLRDRMI